MMNRRKLFMGPSGVEKMGTTTRKGVVLAWQGNYLVVKWPSGSHWMGRGMAGYHPPRVEVFEYIGDADDVPATDARGHGSRAWWTERVSYDVTRK